MPTRKTIPPALPSRADATRRRVIDAAERLLRSGSAEFSMRDLAAEAGVSFATPFNHFGSKVAIMHALSSQRIAAMAERFDAAKPGGDAANRVLVAVDIAVAEMLAEPAVNRAVIGTLGAPGGEPGEAYRLSRSLWAQALGNADGCRPDLVAHARALLPDQLAVAFRGVLSFWTAGEFTDADFAPRARAAASIALLGFVDAARQEELMARLLAGRTS